MVSERSIQSGIVELLRKLHWSVWDLSQPRATLQTPGISDLVAIGRGHILFVEVKTPKGKLRESQKVFGREVLANGGEYLIWRSVNDAWDWLVERHYIEEA